MRRNLAFMPITLIALFTLTACNGTFYDVNGDGICEGKDLLSAALIGEQFGDGGSAFFECGKAPSGEDQGYDSGFNFSNSSDLADLQRASFNNDKLYGDKKEKGWMIIKKSVPGQQRNRWNEWEPIFGLSILATKKLENQKRLEFVDWNEVIQYPWGVNYGNGSKERIH